MGGYRGLVERDAPGGWGVSGWQEESGSISSLHLISLSLSCPLPPLQSEAENTIQEALQSDAQSLEPNKDSSAAFQVRPSLLPRRSAPEPVMVCFWLSACE